LKIHLPRVHEAKRVSVSRFIDEASGIVQSNNYAEALSHLGKWRPGSDARKVVVRILRTSAAHRADSVWSNRRAANRATAVR